MHFGVSLFDKIYTVDTPCEWNIFSIIHIILCFRVDFPITVTPPNLCLHPPLFRLIVYAHYVSIHHSHFLCLLTFIPFITHPSLHLF